MVRIDTKDYSVPTAHAHYSVTTIGNIRELRLTVGDLVVARHTRDWLRENWRNNPLQYLALFARNPDRRISRDPSKTGTCRIALTSGVADLKGSGGPPVVVSCLWVLWLSEMLVLRELTGAIERALAIGALTMHSVRLRSQIRSEQPAPLNRHAGILSVEAQNGASPKLVKAN